MFNPSTPLRLREKNNFAGEDYETPKYYAEDKQFLLDFEDKVIHYEVFAEA